MLANLCLYLAITNMWIIYRFTFKRDYLNDISQCKNPIEFILRYFLTITIGMPALYWLIFFSFITGIEYGRTMTINNRAKELKRIAEKDERNINQSDYLELAKLVSEVRILAKMMWLNTYIIKALSNIRKKLIV